MVKKSIHDSSRAARKRTIRRSWEEKTKDVNLPGLSKITQRSTWHFRVVPDVHTLLSINAKEWKDILREVSISARNN